MPGQHARISEAAASGLSISTSNRSFRFLLLFSFARNIVPVWICQSRRRKARGCVHVDRLGWRQKRAGICCCCCCCKQSGHEDCPRITHQSVIVSAATESQEPRPDPQHQERAGRDVQNRGRQHHLSFGDNKTRADATSSEELVPCRMNDESGMPVCDDDSRR